jgi:putative membrane protein
LSYGKTVGIIDAPGLSTMKKYHLKINKHMKNLFLGICTVSLFLFSSCSNSNSKEAKKAETAESANDQNEKAMGNMEDDAGFLVKAADGGMAEVELGKLGERKGQMVEVRSFAKMMVEHHSSINDQLKMLASSKGVTVPTVMSEDKQKKIDKLSAKNGKEFDEEYIDCMIDGHKKTIKLFENKAEDEKADTDVRKWAVETLPTLRDHLADIEKIETQFDVMKK